MHTLIQDLQYALRTFVQHRAFTLAAVLSLALGIGANTAIFSVASALLLRPLPYADAERLVILWNRSPALGITEDWFSTAQYFDIKTTEGVFEQVAIAIGSNANLTGDGAPERVGTIRVSSNMLSMLGVSCGNDIALGASGSSRIIALIVTTLTMSRTRSPATPKLRRGLPITQSSFRCASLSIMPNLAGTVD